jgi:hypothetical protein
MKLLAATLAAFLAMPAFGGACCLYYADGTSVCTDENSWGDCDNRRVNTGANYMIFTQSVQCYPGICDPLGRCIACDGECWPDVHEAFCDANRGVFVAGGTCTGDAPTGACCYWWYTSEPILKCMPNVTRDCCADYHYGLYQGHGSTCWPPPCVADYPAPWDAITFEILAMNHAPARDDPLNP